MKFKLNTQFKPAGDQPQAIDKIIKGFNKGYSQQTLLGVTGSGKTFTMANIIAKLQKPTLVIAHNKTLAAQLCQEFRDFFPDNAVGYFVSYYDYYQPEAYLASSDTYIEKDAQINDEIDRLRHWATSSLLSRKDVIIVSSVSCIYGLGSPQEYKDHIIHLTTDEVIDSKQLIKKLVNLYYNRNDILERGTFRSKGSVIDISLPNKDEIIRIEFNNEKIYKILILNRLTKNVIEKVKDVMIFPAKHFVVNPDAMKIAKQNIRSDLKDRVDYFIKHQKITEAERLERRTNYDLELMEEIGYCKGIENYSRYLAGRQPGERPDTLIDYFPRSPSSRQADFLTIIDESHVTIPQIRGMYAGDKARKEALIQYGFRLPSALDNRPLKYTEFDRLVGKTLYTSATPNVYELKKSQQIVEQIIRPTGLVDPQIIICPIVDQIKNVIGEIKQETKNHNRVLVTTLTKKMAENLTEYLTDRKIKARYVHSGVDTIDRIRILTDLRKGKFDCLVGVNLLREGLDLPEVTLVAILDADKEGFLRSETSLIQTIGRAARNVNGRVILYADNITNSIKKAVAITNNRREIQIAYNKKNHITPQTIKKNIATFIKDKEKNHLAPEYKKMIDIEKLPSIIKLKEKEMQQLAKELRFEEAALLRDEINALKKLKVR